MRVAKRFRWEGAHRLPWHTGGCQHLHGHSYVLWVEVEGAPDAQGMLIDFKVIKRLLAPLIDAWDHATLVAETDQALREALVQLGTKHHVLPFDTTSENLARYAADHLVHEGAAALLEHRVHTLRVRVQETETCYAVAERRLATGDGATRTEASLLPAPTAR
ncbi:MAG: 6-carboxytetrahydropterin synthase [Bacteroidota bacterium]